MKFCSIDCVTCFAIGALISIPVALVGAPFWVHTKILTLFLSLAEGLGIYLTYKSTGIFINPGPLTGFLVVLSFMAGTALLMWLGEQITTKGVGNGISMLIFVGIIAGLPEGVKTLYKLVFSTTFSTTNLLLALGIILGTIILITAVVFVQQAERRIPVQYSKKVVGRKMMGVYLRFQSFSATVGVNRTGD